MNVRDWRAREPAIWLLLTGLSAGSVCASACQTLADKLSGRGEPVWAQQCPKDATKTIYKGPPMRIEDCSLPNGKRHGLQVAYITESTDNPARKLAKPVKIIEDGFVNGVPEGRRRLWYDDGTLRSEEYFRRGKYHGALRLWREDGSPLLEAQFCDAVPCGAWRAIGPRGESAHRNFGNGAQPSGRFVNRRSGMLKAITLDPRAGMATTEATIQIGPALAYPYKRSEDRLYIETPQGAIVIFYKIGKNGRELYPASALYGTKLELDLESGWAGTAGVTEGMSALRKARE